MGAFVWWSSVCNVQVESVFSHVFQPKYLVGYERFNTADWMARKWVRDNCQAQDYGWKKAIGLNQSLEKGRKMLQRAQESQYDLQKECRG